MPANRDSTAPPYPDPTGTKSTGVVEEEEEEEEDEVVGREAPRMVGGVLDSRREALVAGMEQHAALSVGEEPAYPVGKVVLVALQGVVAMKGAAKDAAVQ